MPELLASPILVARAAIAIYVLFWLIRINGCLRRGRQPLLRGPEWFFDVPVSPDFYSGAGRRLLHQYWLRMLIPFAIDIPVAGAIIARGHYECLGWLILVLVAAIHVNHVYSVDLAERQAGRLVALETEGPVARVAVSLTTRRLREYTDRRVEWVLAVSSLCAIAWIVREYVARPGGWDPRVAFGVPVYFLYVQLGFLLAKCVIVAWRSPVPAVDGACHVKIREERRKYYLAMCDWGRVSSVSGIVCWAVAVGVAPAELPRLWTIWFGGWMVITVVGTVLVEIKRKQLVAIALRARPVRLPYLLGQPEGVRWPLCYEPSAPVMVLRGARGYSLNLAHRLAQLGAAYMVGFIALPVVLPWLR